MDPLPIKPLRPSALALVWKRWRRKSTDLRPLDTRVYLPVKAHGIEVLSGPSEYRATLFALIAKARRRIFITALYLQDDEAGQAVLAALYAAKKAQPALEVAVFVDWHRAQRGLIGKRKSAGNAALYQTMAERLGPGVAIYGVPVQQREIMGVMHLKGFVIDEQVLYSGASLNNIYLQQGEQFRLDRYHLIDSRSLADSLVFLMTNTLRANSAVRPLWTGKQPKIPGLRQAILAFRRTLSKAHYSFTEGEIATDCVGITPLIGLGTRDNELNRTILQLIRHAQGSIVLFTPYFNLPGPIRRALDAKILAGCSVTIIVGDKTANDFYIPPEEPFKTIGALPYLYEANLRRFCKAHQKTIDAGSLNIHLWRHGKNTFHLKGLMIDDDYALLTGNNINPRAWRLDLENGLLIHDPQQHLRAQHQAELARIMAHTERLNHHENLEAVASYPAPVQRLLRRLARVRADRLVNQML